MFSQVSPRGTPHLPHEHPRAHLPAPSHLYGVNPPSYRLLYDPSSTASPTTTLLTPRQDVGQTRQVSPRALYAPRHFAPSYRQTDPSPAREPLRGLANPSLSTASEHMLRRKTPNGTLAAGYDGTPMGRVDPPASGPGDPHPSTPADLTGYAGSLPLRHPNPTPLPWYLLPNSGLGTSQGAVAARDAGWARAPQYRPGIDSVLNQAPAQHVSTYFLPNGAQVPAVLQPMHQSALGPTASNDEAPFGPYWPDGAFIPYRPAALRDPRYYTPYGSIPWASGGGAGRGGLHSAAWQQASAMDPSVGARGNGGGLYGVPRPIFPPAGLDRHGAPAEYPFPYVVDAGPVSDDHSAFRHQRVTPADQTAYGHPLSGQSTPRAAGAAHGLLDPQTSSQRRVALASRADDDLTPTPDGAPRLGSARFRDEVLTWAHTVYVDLLASLHQPSSNGQRLRNGGAPQHPFRASIYPRPPRQPGSSFSAEQVEDAPAARSASSAQPVLLEADADQHSSKRLKRQQEDAQQEDTVQAGTGTGTGTGTGAGSSSTVRSRPDGSRRSSAHSYPNPSRGLAAGAPLSSLNLSGKTRTLRRSSGSTVSPAYAQRVEPTTSPTANAVAALEMLTKLCGEGAWRWVDGMLLGGCLAYGLGDYEKALRWYKKILDADSNHVEAISNLAATLLSLNRREEAEQYWLRSVKLRPSHFEAVEHLIGLLCGDHRGKEAVDIIEFVERSLRHAKHGQSFRSPELGSENGSETSRSSSVTPSDSSEKVTFDYDGDDAASAVRDGHDHGVGGVGQAGHGSSGFAIPGSENGRMLALVHAKGNMLYALGNNCAAARAFQDAILIGAGRQRRGIQGLIRHISTVMSSEAGNVAAPGQPDDENPYDPVLLTPDRALQTARLVFPSHGELPGLRHVPKGMARKAAVSTMSNSLLSLAKIFQDGMSSGAASGPRAASGVRDILALYYLSLALQPSPSTANNVGILLAGVQQSAPVKPVATAGNDPLPAIPGVVPGSGVALALAYYNYGLNLDSRHAHLYTNLGSLLKDIGQLTAAIKMYEQAVACDGAFDIALANLANAVKDQGRIGDAIGFYRRAVAASPDFAEAVCGLANALNSVCGWAGRGGVLHEDGMRDRWHVDEKGMLLDARSPGATGAGWISRVVDIVDRQLRDGESWGRGVLQGDVLHALLAQVEAADAAGTWSRERRERMERTLRSWSGKSWEGARVVRLVERAVKGLVWRWYQDQYVRGISAPASRYTRPQLPPTLSVPAAPTVLPFHTFTCPLSAKQIRLISQRNGLRISCSTLKAPWLPSAVFCPPAPPAPCLNVGYVSSDFNNHPLAHLMQSVFGFHDPCRVKAFCYATTISDNSVHRQQIEREAPVFYDASGWPAERLVRQIVQDGVHIVVNLNGYTRGARNDVFAARPAPIQMSFMGFAGTLGAEWCDYLLADRTAVPPETLRPWRRNVDVTDELHGRNDGGDEDWVYSENVIFAKDTFFCCDHRQSAPDSQGRQLDWDEEQDRRWEMRKALFPNIHDDVVVLGNFNQLYKVSRWPRDARRTPLTPVQIEPTTFRSWLRILARVPNAILWLLRFPELGEQNLKRTAQLWAGQEVASRIIFTDVAPKHLHISRARVCDLFLDTPECNAHTTAADVLWSGTPLLTLPRYRYKMCSRMAASILLGALPKSAEGSEAARELIVGSEEEYEDRVVALASDLKYPRGSGQPGRGQGRLIELRKLLYESRWTSALFDTRRWVRDLERAYWEAWRKWVAGEGGDIWL
ncbi:MAG: hypothetical protein M1832_004509 [Thelocarpon impressellum]|nr:MAG: hypothetical protein M1832_004509 [Thelocarpon impressellum]